MLEFPENYFENEIREGFEVSSMMKRAWAGQLEVLQVIREICERHDIKWFADYGTLLGAIRHKGFIPWDDDIDIGMTRDNLNKFVQYAKAELPEGFKLLCMDLEPEYDSLIVRVVNSTSVSVDEDRMTKFHGCPYVLGIDIFPMDYLARNLDDRALHIQMVDILLGPINEFKDCTGEEIEEYLTQVESLLNVKIDRKKPVRTAILSLVEKLMAIYTKDECDEVTGIWRIIYEPEFHFPKEWFEDLIEVPFENVTIPVPRKMHEVCALKVGADYMTPRRIETHNYPFYKEQEKILTAKLGYTPK